MTRLFAKLNRLYRWLTDRQSYFVARTFGLRVPVFPLMHVPDGFAVSSVGNTGLTLVENFCTPAEAEHLITQARSRLRDSRITINNQQVKDSYRTSKTAIVYDRFLRDPMIVPLLYRAGMLLGLPPAHVETVFVTRYEAGEYYKAHEDFYPGFDGDRLYTVLIYLNDLAEADGGGTVFNALKLGVRPRLGRAVIWTNTNPDGSHHAETTHEALPVTQGEKWAIQLWFRNYPMMATPAAAEPPPQVATGLPLDGTEALPAGAWAVTEVTPGSPYDKAFS
jgi:prolyl 4-hydroxylase